MTTAFRVTLRNAPGALADLAGALGEQGVNIEGSGGEEFGEGARLTLMTSDAAATRAVLEERNVEFQEVEALRVALQDNPGALGRIARRFADAGVNVLSLVQLSRTQGQSELAFVVDDVEKARSLLG